VREQTSGEYNGLRMAAPLSIGIALTALAHRH